MLFARFAGASVWKKRETLEIAECVSALPAATPAVFVVPPSVTSGTTTTAEVEGEAASAPAGGTEEEEGADGSDEDGAAAHALDDDDEDVSAGAGVEDEAGAAEPSPVAAAGAQGSMIWRLPYRSDICLEYPIFKQWAVKTNCLAAQSSSQKSIAMGTLFHLVRAALGPLTSAT